MNKSNKDINNNDDTILMYARKKKKENIKNNWGIKARITAYFYLFIACLKYFCPFLNCCNT